MPNYSILAVLAAAIAAPLVTAVSSQAYTWKNVKIGGGGG
jgi:xyloglucan-specific exo-beta-1,4-glucanase